ncbi:MAG TPA: c-type cytochrome [Methylovirgula sp.]|nr:c-type cytochrome [Methylovirgula sp.]
MNRRKWSFDLVVCATQIGSGLLGLLILNCPAFSQTNLACTGSNGGINLPPGFCATIFADNIGHVRHMVVSPDNVLYVNNWIRDFRFKPPLHGGLLVALKDSKGTGKADVIMRFGLTQQDGSLGGSGIAFYNRAIYAEQDDKIIRFALKPGEIAPTSQPETVVSGLPVTGDHPMHTFIISAAGQIFVDVGSPSDACQEDNRKAGSPGKDHCPELETGGGTWRYDANQTDQHFSAARRYATGIRNGEGFAFDADGQLYVTQHGRDLLSQNWPQFYKAGEGVELPAEVIFKAEQGGDYGWPYCYFDPFQKKQVLGPEYGGDGGHKVGVCAEKKSPVAFFPAHLAPNDLLIYSSKAFPTAYRGGMFIAFHGSYNRAPAPQQGYEVVFQPFAHGRTTGDYVVFANNFAGPIMEPGRAEHRPTGLATGPDGALYISDDVKGRIWRVTYSGPSDAKVEGAASPTLTADAKSKRNDGRPNTASLPVPKGATKAQIALGDRIFHGEAASGTCAGCHGSDAKGSPKAPDLTSGIFVQSPGDFKSIIQTITNGVAKPVNYADPMPPLGGAALSQSDVTAVAAYVWALSHKDMRKKHAKK